MIPGTLFEPSFPLARYRTHQVSGHLNSLIHSITEPGEIILEINTSGTAYVHEALENTRRILAININPISMLITHTVLNPVDVTQVRAALTNLGDSPKGSQPLITHLNQQYRSKCPECAHEGIAAWFAWDRDTQQPFFKCVHCQNCGCDREGAADESDALQKNLNPTTGLAYHVALERAASHDESIRPRISELVSLYTNRNLSALMDVIHRLPQVTNSPDTRRILTVFVLEALDHGSCLSPYGNPDTRPKSLRPPRMFLEYNIWDLLENAMQAYSAQTKPNPIQNAPTPSLQSFITQSQGYFLIANTLQSVVPRLPNHEIKLVILHSEIPDVVYWALSSLWSTWLWKSEILPPAFRAYMGRRRIDQEWHQQDLVTTLHEIKPSLDLAAKILCPLATNSISSLEDTLAALRTTGYRVESWLNADPDGYRLLFTPATVDHMLPPTPPLQHYANTLGQRGEPTLLQQLKAAYLIEEPNALAVSLPSQLSSEFITYENTEYIWLANDSNTLKPLADRVEESILQCLQRKVTWMGEELEAEIYRQFNGPQTPDPELVQVCINAYTLGDEYNTVTLRPEDTPKTRRNELRMSRIQIEQLGIQLGFTVGRRLNGDIVWKEPGNITFMFRFTSTALLTPHLLNVPRAQASERRYLVLPGGRASLVALKLRRDPRLFYAITNNNWGFIKFRHLRRMLTEIRHRGEIDFYLGLDPVVEKDTAQIPLPLERQ
jgi:hypothetical protein